MHIAEEKHEPSGRVIHFTSRQDSVYVFCPVDGTPGEITLDALGTGQLRGRRIAAVSLLGSEEEAKWSQENGRLTLAVPSAAPGGIIATYRVKLRE